MSVIYTCEECGGTQFTFMRYIDENAEGGWRYDSKKDMDASTCKCLTKEL